MLGSTQPLWVRRSWGRSFFVGLSESHEIVSERWERWTCGLLGCVLAFSACTAPGGDAGLAPVLEADVWRSELIAWRAEREAGLRDPEGYLGLSDLVWLRDGVQAFGSGPEAALRLQGPDIPERAGSLELRDGQLRLVAEPGVALLVDGEPVRDVVLRSAADGDWRLPARFLPYAAPHDVAIPNVLGSTYEGESPGRLEFEWRGATYTLEPTGSDPAGLFLVFGDATNGRRRTAAAASCASPSPTPTAANRLPFEVTAGERAPAGH